MDFRDVLPGIAVRRTHQHRHRFIDNLFPVHDMPKRQHAVHERFPIFRAEHPCEDLFASASADAYNGNAAFARRRRLRGDGIQMMIHAHFPLFSHKKSFNPIIPRHGSVEKLANRPPSFGEPAEKR